MTVGISHTLAVTLLKPTLRVVIRAGVISWRGALIDVTEHDVDAYVAHGAHVYSDQHAITSKGEG